MNPVVLNSSIENANESARIGDIDDKTASDPYKIALVTLSYFNSPAQVTIKKTVNLEKQIKFTAYFTCEGEETEIGHITCEWIRNFPNGEYKSDSNTNLTSEYARYGYGLESKVDKIWVDDLQSRYASFKGVASALMQASIEYGYSKHCFGRINLVAGLQSHGFYYKQGMRIGKEELDAIIEKNLAVIPRPYFKNICMHMTAEGRASWKEKIRSNPIYPETAKHLEETR